MPLIHYANKLKPGSQTESEFALDGFGCIQQLQNEETEANWIYNQIVELLNLGNHKEIEGQITLDNMVIIARNRFVFQTIEGHLTANNIPFTLKKGERNAEPSSVFGKILDLAIRLRLNSKDWVDGKKLCAVLKINAPNEWGQNNLLQKFADAVRKSNIPYPDIQSDILIAVQNLDVDQPSIPKLCNEFSSMFERISLNAATDIDGELERSLQELQDFRKCWTTFKRKGLGDSLSSFRNAMALGQLTDDYSDSGLTLSTVHTMKGLEKDIVFLMGMCEGVFPDYRATTQKEIAEELNNAFVAVTRSRRWIYITYPMQRMMPWGSPKTQSPSRFILQMNI